MEPEQTLEDAIKQATAFRAMVHQCYDRPEFVREFDRLTGSNLGRKGSVIIQAVDVATGKSDADMRRFIEFVRETVWDRLPPDQRLAVLAHASGGEGA